MVDAKKIESIILENGYNDFKWIAGSDVVIAQWPRFKCMFGCSLYGKKGACPPSVPSIAECGEFFSEYENIVVIHIQKKLENPEQRKEWSRRTNLHLLKLEKAAFLAGYHKAFLLFMNECQICDECSGTRNKCKNVHLSRPSPEALGVDVFATVRKLSLPIEVLTDDTQEMNRYSFLMIE
jgi:predicted metal-binding protein